MKTSQFLGRKIVSVLAIAMLSFGCSSEPDNPLDPLGTGGTAGSGGAAGTRGGGASGGSDGLSNAGLIGPEGGVVTAEQGVTVTIPAGALASETTIAATVVDASGLPARPSGTTAVGPFVALTPHGTQFAMPVEVMLPYTSSSGSLTVLRIDDESDNTWESLPGASFDGANATIDLSQFSVLTVAAMGAGGTGGSGGTGGNASCEGVDNCIGPEGGYVNQGNPSVYIPPGALTSETPIGADVIDGVGLPSFPEGLEAAGPFVELTPHGTQFAVPAEVTLPYDCITEDLKVLRIADENDTTWEVLTPSHYSTGTANMELTRFSILIAVVNTCRYFDSCTTCTSNEDCESHEFCAKDSCAGPGVCRQGTCRGSRPGIPGVCGCDGRTYESPRAAGEARVNVASTGRCECDNDLDCVGQFETCEPFYLWAWSYGVPSCDASLGCMSSSGGSCSPDPNAPDACCPDRPVCGCDGVTYDCPSAAADVGIAAYSACE